MVSYILSCMPAITEASKEFKNSHEQSLETTSVGNGLPSVTIVCYKTCNKIFTAVSCFIDAKYLDVALKKLH